MARKSQVKSAVESYFKKNPAYNSVVHLLIGAGFGILLTHTVIDPHPMRWGLGLIILGALGHLYPWAMKK